MIASSAPPVLTVEARRVIRASSEHVFAYLARVEHLPRYGSPLWMTADPLEKRGATQVIALSGYFAGLPVESLQRVALRPPVSLEVSQIRGTLRAFAGHCTLARGEEGTEVLYHLDVDPGIPMVTEDTARQCLVQYLERLLDRIRLAAERKAPVRRPQVPPAAASGAPAVSEANDLEPEPEEERVRPAGQEEGPARASASDVAVRADVSEPVPASAAPPSPGANVTGQPAPAGRSPGTPARPGPNGSSAGRHRRHRRRRRRYRGGGPSAPGAAPRPPA